MIFGTEDEGGAYLRGPGGDAGRTEGDGRQDHARRSDGGLPQRPCPPLSQPLRLDEAREVAHSAPLAVAPVPEAPGARRSPRCARRADVGRARFPGLEANAMVRAA